MSSLNSGSIVKVDRFEVARCSSMYKITDHPFLIRFISSTIIDEVITGALEINLQSIWQICYAQGFDLTKETTRVIIRLFIDPKTNTNYTVSYLTIYKLTFADVYEEDEDDNQDQ
ncbi:hypothetical protein YC2023_089582 [Brassica napus]